LSCGKVIEFNDAPLQARQDEIAREYQFVIQERAMTLYGVCKECQANKKN
jgi:Fur family ferric uptake transcriptional regulator